MNECFGVSVERKQEDGRLIFEAQVLIGVRSKWSEGEKKGTVMGNILKINYKDKRQFL